MDSLECHEAGFDSLMTGYSFIKGACLLNTKLETLADPESFAKEFKLYRNRVLIKVYVDSSGEHQGAFQFRGWQRGYLHEGWKQASLLRSYPALAHLTIENIGVF